VLLVLLWLLLLVLVLLWLLLLLWLRLLLQLLLWLLAIAIATGVRCLAAAAASISWSLEGNPRLHPFSTSEDRI
jgi:hypothetical protein